MTTSMAATPKTVIFDSSGLVSLVKADDLLHKQAVEIAQALTDNGWSLLLPYEVLAESLNTIARLVNKHSAVIVGESLIKQYATQKLTFVQSEPHVVTSALRRLKSAAGKPSFIDCLVMACADEHKTRYIFGFDTAFRKNGYYLPPTK